MRARLETPIGTLVVEAVAHGVVRCGTRLDLHDERHADDDSAEARRHLDSALEALREYFARRRRDFDDLVLAAGGTPFRRRVWRELRRIPYGETLSYGALAARIGRPGSARAVGAANGANPIAIVQPCHRVIGADGRLVGFGGGIPMKSWLLRHEGALLA